MKRYSAATDGGHVGTERAPAASLPSAEAAGKDLDPGVSRTGKLFMLVLALQFGLQPVVQKACVDKHTVNPVSLIIVIELIKISLCTIVIFSSGLYRSMLETWTLRRSLAAAALPAAGYALQNWLSQLAYKNLDSLTFNLLSQTKTLFAALCLYLVMGKKQSRRQLVALSLLLGAALLLNSSNTSAGSSGGGGSVAAASAGKSRTPLGTGDHRELAALEEEAKLRSAQLWLGAIPVLGAAFLSGLCGVLTQRTLQRSGYSASQLSLELGVYGVLTLLLTLGCGLGGGSNAGGESWRQDFFRGWTRWTWVPVVSQAAGGLVVGQVTKHAGSVRKGFALIGGILVTAVVQSTLEKSALTLVHWTAAVLVVGGTYLHSTKPTAPKKLL